jgi:hypothetical protein
LSKSQGFEQRLPMKGDGGRAWRTAYWLAQGKSEMANDKWQMANDKWRMAS